jgi:hypothetical protein
MTGADVRPVQSTPQVGLAGDVLGVISMHFRQPHRPADSDLCPPARSPACRSCSARPRMWPAGSGPTARRGDSVCASAGSRSAAARWPRLYDCQHAVSWLGVDPTRPVDE